MTTTQDDDFYLFDGSLAATPNDFDTFLNDAEQEVDTQAVIKPSDLIKKETNNDSPFNTQQNHRGSSSSSSDESVQHRRNDSAVSAASSAFAHNWDTGINGYTMPANQMFNDSPMGGVDGEFEASNRQMATDFDFDTAASTPSGLDAQMSYSPTPQALKRNVNVTRFGKGQQPSPRMTSQRPGFYIANSREASPLNAMLPGPQGQSPWSKHSPSAGLEETFNTINMNGDSPNNPTFSPNMQFNGGFSFEPDSSATPSSLGISSPPSTVPSANDGRPQLIIQPTSLKSRVETQIPITLTLSPMPPGAKRLMLPRNTVSKPKFLIKGEHEPSVETLELHTSLVCTSAMQDNVKMQRALARARGEDLAAYSRPSPDSSASSTSSKDDEDKPLNGGEVRICSGCIQRERKRAGRKKQKKPEEEEAFARDEEKRVVVFNTSQIKDWVEVPREPPEDTASAAPRGHSAPPGSMQVELPMRIACYCRHQNEKLGFQVIFTIKDYRGRVISQGLTNPIMITDDHKTHTAPAVPPTSIPLPNAPAVPGAGVFQTTGETPAPAPKVPKMFKQSFSTTDLNGLQNNFNPNFPMGTSSNPFAISNTTSGTITPRNALSRPASPSGPQGPTAKKRKQSGSGKLPTGLTMTRLDTAPAQPPQQPLSMSAANSPYAQNISAYMPPPQSAFPAPAPMRPLGTGTSPPTPNGIDYINRSFSLENLPRQVMISAPPSRQPSRPGSPGSGRNSFSGPEQTLSGVNNQLMNQTRRAPPLIHKLVPAEGSVTGGTEVTLLGNGFYQGLEVMFGDTEATTTTFWGEKCLNCIAPPALQPGTVSVVFKHEHRNYVQQSPQARPMLFTYTDDRELEMFRLALRTIGKQMSHPTDDPYSAAQQLLQGSQQSMWGAPSGYMGQQRGGGGAPMDTLELENTMVQLLDFMDLRAPTALTSD
ncbi:Ankyrin and IPT/TIG repeat-containing protein C26H5.05 [Cyphellophora attinorum]|uniref:Ankyrin and IPT/TIG repeat-containing protein C26H5.05 n=1 Tax=Cyphellophora attinorum TaxID=1664694 RepID=A0A0N1HI51_9EURO|nr:Ankyrin and IPT/TIG repeat-containing protein C26H5.05 [Phialophora attinorum]KPI35672.1 Ankyrin and IPT/TIG repeat-containing protein C26H5.05 [Phialophora attinorum]